MSFSELLFLALVASVGVGYGVREYGLFIATHRHPDPPFPYPPERLWRRLKLSALLVAEAVSLALTLWVARQGSLPVTSLALGLVTLGGLVALTVAAVADLRDTRRQYARLKEQALLDAREVWRATQDAGAKRSRGPDASS